MIWNWAGEAGVNGWWLSLAVFKAWEMLLNHFVCWLMPPAAQPLCFLDVALRTLL